MRHFPVAVCAYCVHPTSGRRAGTTTGSGTDAFGLMVFCGLNILKEKVYMSSKRTAIVTGASQGIGAALVEALLNAGYNIVATSRNVNQSLAASSNLVLVAGDIGNKDTAVKVVAAAMENFGSIDLLVTNAGIFFTKPFTGFTNRVIDAVLYLAHAGQVSGEVLHV